jgi:hypothetical protein
MVTCCKALATWTTPASPSLRVCTALCVYVVLCMYCVIYACVKVHTTLHAWELWSISTMISFLMNTVTRSHEHHDLLSHEHSDTYTWAPWSPFSCTQWHIHMSTMISFRMHTVTHTHEHHDLVSHAHSDTFTWALKAHVISNGASYTHNMNISIDIQTYIHGWRMYARNTLPTYLPTYLPTCMYTHMHIHMYIVHHLLPDRSKSVRKKVFLRRSLIKSSSMGSVPWVRWLSEPLPSMIRRLRSHLSCSMHV